MELVESSQNLILTSFIAKQDDQNPVHHLVQHVCVRMNPPVLVLKPQVTDEAGVLPGGLFCTAYTIYMNDNKRWVKRLLTCLLEILECCSQS